MALPGEPLPAAAPELPQTQRTQRKFLKPKKFWNFAKKV
jgi:hypothetical protein